MLEGEFKEERLWLSLPPEKINHLLSYLSMIVKMSKKNSTLSDCADAPLQLNMTVCDNRTDICHAKILTSKTYHDSEKLYKS